MPSSLWMILGDIREPSRRCVGYEDLPDNAPLRLIAAGPGRLCQAFGITRANTNGLDFTDPASPLQIVDDGFHAKEIVATPRIGISKAAERPLRFYLAGSPFISGKR